MSHITGLLGSSLALYMVITRIYCQTITLPRHTKWIVPFSDRDDMFCPYTCLLDGEYDRCCGCLAKPCWEINTTACGVTVGYLSLEYIDIFGTTMIFDNTRNNVDLHVLEHTNSKMIELPTNICELSDTLTKLDLSYNRIENADAVKCLTKLDTLLLNNNLITRLSNSTLSEMVILRVLSLANNDIKVLEPNTISVPNANIFFVDFSNNTLESIDITNFFREGNFCEVDYSNCDLGTVTNIQDFKANLSVEYGPGDMFLNNSNMGQLFDLTSIGIKDYAEVGIFLKGQIHLDAGSVHCDCSMYPLFKGMGDQLFDYWPDLYNTGIDFVCQSPPHMVGVKLNDYYRNGSFDDLTCDIVENCTDRCVCTDKPSENLVIVDCRNKSLISLPERLPVGRFNALGVKLLLDGNFITRIDYRPDLDRIRVLQMPDNDIDYIQSDIIIHLTNTEINVQDQKLSSLPKPFLNIDPNNVISGDHPVACDCDNLWVGNWIRAHDATNRLYCDAKGERIYAEYVSEDRLGCYDKQNNVLKYFAIVSAVFLSTLLLIILTVKYKTEILLFKRRYKKTKRSGSPAVFISMGDENDEVFRFVHYSVRPALRHLQIKVTVPWYDFTPGGEIDTDLSEAVTASDVLVVFLCDMYQGDLAAMAEFNAIWNVFVKDKSKDIIVINWEGLESREIRDKRMRALCRTGYAMEFDNHDVRMMKRIAKRTSPEVNVDELPEKFLMFSHEANQPDTEEEQKRSNPHEQESDDYNGAFKDDNVLEVLPSEDENRSPEFEEQRKLDVNVFQRLYKQQSEICECKYRKCYVHMFHQGDDSLYDYSSAWSSRKTSLSGSDGRRFVRRTSQIKK